MVTKKRRSQWIIICDDFLRRFPQRHFGPVILHAMLRDQPGYNLTSVDALQAVFRNRERNGVLAAERGIIILRTPTGRVRYGFLQDASKPFLPYIKPYRGRKDPDL